MIDDRTGPAPEEVPDGSARSGGPGSVQERFEDSWIGRAAISGFVLFTILGLLVSNLPADSHIRNAELRYFDPYLVLSGLKQRWGVFSPNPTRNTMYISARIDFEDGTSRTWRTPSGDRVIGTYRFYRWRQFAVDVEDRRSRHLAEPFARWLARTHTPPGKVPTQVTLLRRTALTPRPGTSATRRWKETAFYRLRLPAPGQTRP